MAQVGARSRVLEVRGAGGLDEVAGLIHDCDFHLGGVRHDRQARTVTVPYDRELAERGQTISAALFIRRVRVPTFRWYLTFHDVSDYRIEDTEKVEIYNFNVVAYDEERSVLTVRSNIPLTFELHVDAVHIAIDATDEIVKTRNTLGLRARRS